MTLEAINREFKRKKPEPKPHRDKTSGENLCRVYTREPSKHLTGLLSPSVQPHVVRGLPHKKKAGMLSETIKFKTVVPSSGIFTPAQREGTKTTKLAYEQ